MAGRRPEPILIVNPATDRQLERLAVELAADPGCTPTILEAALRGQYPDLGIHRRELSGEPCETWYVYRDGHWIAEMAVVGPA